MSYLDESEYDEAPGPENQDSRRGDRRRATQPARPAWDAATYGTPDDTRRARPGPPPPSDGGTSGTGARSDRYTDDGTDPMYRSEPPTSYPSDSYRAGSTTDYLGGTDYSNPDPSPTDAGSSSTDSASGGYSSSGDYSVRSDTSYGSSDYGAAPDYGATSDYGSTTDVGAATDFGATAEFGAYRDPGNGNGTDHAERPDSDEPAWADEAAAYPGGVSEADASPQRKSRAGRNLPAAIGVGVGLAGAALASLFLWRPAFLGVIAVAVGVGIWELVRAIRTNGVNPPLIPLVAGGGLMSGLAWWGHLDALTFGLIVTVLAAMFWRLADGAGGYGRDVTAATLVAVYVPFLAGFAALLASAPADGDRRMLVTLAGVVLSDTGGYVAGVFLGKHSMAPLVSPKKSWEGLAGSLVATAVGGALMLYFLFDVAPWWGAVFGLAVSAASVLGDLGESMIKRDLGVKDMSSLLPGHGGLMDRLDSILFAAPTAYIMLVLLAPPG